MPTLHDYRSLADVGTTDELFRALLAVAHQLDFGLLSAQLIIDGPNHPSPSVTVLANHSSAWAQFAMDPVAARRDPVQQRCKYTSLPFAWDQTTYVDDGAADLWDLQAPFGYRTGIGTSLHLERRRHFLIGFDREEPLPSNERQMADLLGHLQLLAIHAKDAALKLLTPTAVNVPALTRREVEVLYWTMLGKDAQTAADILGLSRRTAKFHIDNAIAKLDCETKHAAVLKALDYGLLNRVSM